MWNVIFLRSLDGVNLKIKDLEYIDDITPLGDGTDTVEETLTLCQVGGV